jgi:hypothetical protein
MGIYAATAMTASARDRAKSSPVGPIAAARGALIWRHPGM